MKRFILIISICLLIATNALAYTQKWYGPGGHITLKNGKLYVGGSIYYPSGSSGNKWHGSDGYIKLKDGKLYTPYGVFYPTDNKKI